jgi:hypothetical protein
MTTTTAPTLSIVRSNEELELRYLRFCLLNEMEEDLRPEEQFTENAKQQKWLDNHVQQRERLKREAPFYDHLAVAHIQHDLMERFGVPQTDIERICGHIEPKPTKALLRPPSAIGNLVL